MSPWQRYMSADVTGATLGGDVTAAYCPVCSPVYAGAHYQRYAAPSGLNADYCRRPDLDVYRSPDLLGPLTDTTSGELASCSAAALRVVSCSAPDLIELSSRVPQQRAAADETDRCMMTSFPAARHVSQSTAVVCGEQLSPSSGRRRTTK